MSDHLLSLAFLTAAAAALFDCTIMPRWRTSTNVRTRQSRLRFWSNFDRSVTFWIFVVCAVLATVSFVFELQNA